MRAALRLLARTQRHKADEQHERDKENVRRVFGEGIEMGINAAKQTAPQFEASLKLDAEAIAAFQQRYPNATFHVRLKRSTSIKGYKGMQPVGKEVLVNEVDFEYLTIVYDYADEVKPAASSELSDASL